MKKASLWLFATLFSLSSLAQSSSEIQHDLEKLMNFHSALYIAAHPDDENTRVIAWLSKGRLVSTSYLSLTRGDGGQNLIGEELGPELGMLRTQELLAARRIDGGNQFFSRAVDFGYSKTAEETLSFWDKEEILKDVVRVIRRVKPEVIITRFPPDRRAGHGHHTASAKLALEAYDKASDPDFYPSEFVGIKPWQVHSVYWNASSWWNPDLDSIAANDPKYLAFDIGGFDPLLGVNYNELGSRARSQHKCQGFGVSIQRGSTMEYFQWLKGDVLENDFFDNERSSWNQITGREDGDQWVQKIISDYDPKNPGSSVEELVSLLDALEAAPPSEFSERKKDELAQLIVECAGLHAEALAPDYFALASEEVVVKTEWLQRNPTPNPLVIKELRSPSGSVPVEEKLPLNTVFTKEIALMAPEATSQPYWLINPYDKVYSVDNSSNIGKPVNDPALEVEAVFSYGNITFVHRIPVIYKWSERVEGELKRPFGVTPKVAGNLSRNTYVVVGTNQLMVTASLTYFGSEPESIQIGLTHPSGNLADAQYQTVSFDHALQEVIVTYNVTIPENIREFSLTLLGPKAQALPGLQRIEYSHIPYQISFTTKTSKAIRPALEVTKGRIAYVQGAGDQVDKALREMGCEVVNLSPEDLSTVSLGQFQTIVFGIRAFNVYPQLSNAKDAVLAYMQAGGNVVVQYNTSSSYRPTPIPFAPYDLQIGRGRISDETAELKVVSRNRILKEPNRISPDDYKDWVQERGLYFGHTYSDDYDEIFEGHDAGEDPLRGALLVAEYGEGRFIYTGISFFRQLPAGVSGAYVLLANLVSYEQ